MTKIAVCIATSGRRDVLSATIRLVAQQSRLPDQLLICPVSPDDVDVAELQSFPAPAQVVTGPRGLPHQRNALISQADADLIVLLDDDFFIDPLYLAECERLFAARPDLVVATGRVLADGILGPGISTKDGLAILAAAPPLTEPESLSPRYNGYGCNMVVRIAVARQHSITFDEKLPLYAWWEDVDYCRRLAPYGEIMFSNRLRGVHLGSKSGRTPGKRLGYSQVANIHYLCAKGSIEPWVAFKRIAMNVAANLFHSVKPEPWVDRRGRLAGNVLAFRDWILGTLSPDKIFTFN